MKKYFLLPGLLAVFAAVLLLGCGSLFPASSATQTALNDLVTTQWAAYGAGKANFGGGLALYIMSPGGNYYAATNLPGANENTHFRGASTTKSFAGAAIMLLAQQNKLDIDDLITASIPGSSESYVPATAAYNIPKKGQITIRQLLDHRAGVFDVANSSIPSTESAPYAGQNYIDYVKTSDPTHEFTCDELVGVVATHQLKYFDPGTYYHYSDTGYSLLGKIVERVSGQRFDQYVHDNLLVPNGLTETTFPYLGDDRTLPSPFEPGYSYTGGSLTEVTTDNMSPHVAEGNVVTTPRDLATWIKKLITGRAGLSTATVAKMTAVMSMETGGNYGLGVFHVPGLGYGHNGGHNGYLTVAFCDPTQEVAVVVSAAVINWDDLVGEMTALYNIGRTAKTTLCYSTAEAY